MSKVYSPQTYTWDLSSEYLLSWNMAVLEDFTKYIEFSKENHTLEFEWLLRIDSRAFEETGDYYVFIRTGGELSIPGFECAPHYGPVKDPFLSGALIKVVE